MSTIDIRPTEVLLDEANIRPFRWDIEAFYQAVKAGIFPHPERLELIEGEILETMSAQETPHIQSVLLIAEALRTITVPICHVRTQSPLSVNRATEPEPDVLLVRGGVRDYDGRKPEPLDVLLLVEVSASTLHYDRGRKAAIYAGAGIVEYWIVDLNARSVEVYRDPAPATESSATFAYRTRFVVSEEQTLVPVVSPGLSFPVKMFLPNENKNENEEERAIA